MPRLSGNAPSGRTGRAGVEETTGMGLLLISASRWRGMARLNIEEKRIEDEKWIYRRAAKVAEERRGGFLKQRNSLRNN